jgi:hypothetical protein
MEIILMCGIIILITGFVTSNKTGATSEAGTAFLSGAPEFTLGVGFVLPDL